MKIKNSIFLFIIFILIDCNFCFPQNENTNQRDSLFLRVMTYNIHHGEGIDGKIDLNKIAKLIREKGPDLVALQEVDQGVERSLGINILDSLASLTKMYPYFDKNIDFQGGEYGNGILSRLPILVKYNHHYKMIREGEQRGLLQAVVNFLGYEILFMNTHIDYRSDDSERVLNASEIKEEIKKYPAMPIIVCGDFNDTTFSRTVTKMKEKFIDVWELLGEGKGFSYPSDYPEKRIDYIFFTNSEDEKNEIYLEPRSIKVLRSAASDHLPVIAEFKIVKRFIIDKNSMKEQE